MNHINNDPDHILIRKSQNTLIVVGMGTVLFSVWTAVKTLGTLFLLKDETVAAARKIADENGLAVSDKSIFLFILVATFLFMLLFVGIRTQIGLAAISEGRGRRRRKGYLILAAIIIIVSVLEVISNIILSNPEASYGALSADTSLSSSVIELTSMVMLTEMIVSAVRLRKARLRVRQSAVQNEQE